MRGSSLWVLLSLLLPSCAAEVAPAEPPPAPVAGKSEAPEREPCNALDDDGDGQVDEGCGCAAGQTQACFPGPASLVQGTGPEGPRLLGRCALGVQSCSAAPGTEFGGVWGECTGAVLPQEEICGDQIDQDCDGQDLPCPNVAPAASDDQASAVAEATLVIDVLANDSDPEQDALSVVEVSQGSKGGTVSISADGKKVSYVLNAVYVEKDSFSYKVSDGKSTSQATVQVSVAPDCRFALYWPHFYWGVVADYSSIPGAVWNQGPGQGAVCGDAASTSCSAGGYLYLKGRDLGDPLGRGRTEICRKRL